MIFSNETNNSIDIQDLSLIGSIASQQSYCEMIARLDLVQKTVTGAMFFELINFLADRIDAADNNISVAHSKVLLAIEQIEKTEIPYLIARPQKLNVLTGLLADLNTEITCARTATSAIALRAHEIGYPVQMGEIAREIDEALGLQDKPRISMRGRRRHSPAL